MLVTSARERGKMKHFVLAVLIGCLSAYAQDTVTSVRRPVMKALTPDQRKLMLQRTGGLLNKPVHGPFILFLDLRKNTKDDVLTTFADDAQKVLRFPIKIEKEATTEVFQVLKMKLENSSNASVVAIIDESSFANLLIAPENRWAVVNVAPLKTKNVTNVVLSERIRKEIWRAFGLMMGAGNSAYPQCPLKSVLKPEDLDAIKGRFLSPGPLNNMIAHGKLLGLQQLRLTTYKRACEEGWAPAPTNNYQKAIWNEIKTGKHTP